MSQETTSQQQQMLWELLNNCHKFYQSSSVPSISSLGTPGWARRRWGQRPFTMATISMLGFYWFRQLAPVAVAKQVAKHNTIDKEEHSFTLIREFLKFMLLLGAVLQWLCTCSRFRFYVWRCSDLRQSCRVCLAVLIFPPMSVIRGFFKVLTISLSLCHQSDCGAGHSVIWMLLTAFFIMKIGSKLCRSGYL